jgi:hypothetical protein
MFAKWRKSRADRKLWRQAESLPELCGLMARWLEGAMVWRPDAGPDLDPETLELVGLLARVNRAGFLTTDSQPGCDETGYDGRRWVQRAAVTGFVAGDRTLHALARVAEAFQLTFLVRSAHDQRDLADVTGTRVDGGAYTWFGARLTPRDLQHIWRGVSPAALGEITGALQVTLIDPVYGRNDPLWAALDEALSLLPTA